ncbi:MAG: GNAT family N-acetyltransferase [Clostridia bacterium]|nr:GNAT family N-acetyltransferase [Clostridia bacterium]
MEIVKMKHEHLVPCAKLLIEAYNGLPWNNNWNDDSSIKYLMEYFVNPSFAGFIIIEDEKVIGAAFCHEKTWWTGDELFIDEFYISPVFQHRGLGTELLKHIENYVEKRKLAGITLLTNRHMPSLDFYVKNKFTKAKHIVFMYKELK